MISKYHLALTAVAFMACGCASETKPIDQLIFCEDTETSYACSEGSQCCQGICCEEGSMCCGSACMPISELNCGGCGIQCGTGQQCLKQPSGSMACICPSTGETCNGTCCETGCVKDLSSDPANCGTCANACNPGEICSEGQCVTSCQSHLTRCETENGEICTNTKIDPLHCGNCDTKCDQNTDPESHISGVFCDLGTCRFTCENGFLDKDGSPENGCEYQLPVCGNGIIEDGEICDGDDINGVTCAEHVGFGSTGTPACHACTSIDYSACTPPNPCGNGELDPGEECDGSQFMPNKDTCETYSAIYGSGTLTCNDKCQIDDSKCELKCGNGEVDAGEKCDGNNLAGKTCADLVGFGSLGELKCESNCISFDTSGCSPAVQCGNGELDIGKEECDGNLFSNQVTTCTQYDSSKYSAGNLKCQSNCTLSFDECELKCGNGKIDAGEQCDSSNFDGETCESLRGFGSTGQLKCTSKCTIDATNCSEPKTCGNGNLDSSEICDGTLFRNDQRACADYQPQYASGMLKCTQDCQLDTSDCKMRCGNDAIDQGEACDGNNFAGQTCESVVGYGSTGSLKCISCNQIDASGCSAAVQCGNGKLDVYEECDASAHAFANDIEDCALFSSKYESGKLTCNANCTINESACVKKCGNNVKDIVEKCDGSDFGGLTCATLTGDPSATGALICNDQCSSIDESDCKYCGDGIISGTEECDGINWNGITDCYSLDSRYAKGVGTLSCNASCGFDRTQCIDACAEGSVRCSAGSKQIEKCNSNGVWDTIQVCQTTTPWCALVNDTPACVCRDDSECGAAFICEGGTCREKCAENTLQCSVSGSSQVVQKCVSGRWKDEQTCSGTNAFCNASLPSCVECTLDTHCPTGKTCANNTCVTACETGSYRCNGDHIQKCNKIWQDFENCAADSKLCHVTTTEHACVECINDTDCPTGKVCTNTNVCKTCKSEGSFRCDGTGNIIQKCTDGEWTQELSCLEYGKDTNQTICQVLTDGYECVECLDNANCPSTAPICNTATNTCAQCMSDTDCPTNKVCKTDQNICIECQSDSDCNPGYACEDNLCRSNPRIVKEYGTDFEWIDYKTVYYSTSYKMRDTVGFTLIATGRTDLMNSSKSYAIDGKGIIIRTNATPTSNITVSELTDGIGTVSFDTLAWTTGKVRVIIGTNTFEAEAGPTRSHVSFPINIIDATEFKITSVDRVTIDNLVWTSSR